MVNSLHVIYITLYLIGIAIAGYSLIHAFTLFFRFQSGVIDTVGHRIIRDDFFIIEILPYGFSLFAVLSFVIYAIGFHYGWDLQDQSILNIVFLIAGLAASVTILLGFSNHIEIPASIFTNLPDLLRYYAPVPVIVAITSFVLGRYPFFVSDDFGHLTIINRIIESGSLSNPALYMPGDDWHTFFPWHATLASIGLSLGFGSLETFASAKIFLSVTVVMSFMSFCGTVFRGEKRRNLYVLCSAIAYAFLTPAIYVFHGMGDYRGVTSILIFQAARIIWIAAVFRDTKTSHYVIFFFIILAASLIHLMDVLIFLMMFFPYLLYLNIRAKNKGTVFTLFFLGGSTVSIALIIKAAFYSSVSAMRLDYSSVDIIPYLKHYVSRVDFEYGIPLLLLTVAAPLFFTQLRTRSPALLYWPIGTLLASLLLGSVNPLLTDIYAKTISSNLMDRTMYAVPLALPLGICLASLVIWAASIIRHKKFKYSYLIALVFLAAIGRQVWVRYGLSGDPSYAWSGEKQSLLAKQPNLFKYIQSINHKTILTDMITSAPITAVSSNYTFTNRPWVELKKGRIEQSVVMMQAVGKREMASLFCKNGIDVLLLNPNAPFDHKLHANWVFGNYYHPDQRPLTERYLSHFADIDGASIYVFDRSRACVGYL